MTSPNQSRRHRTVLMRSWPASSLSTCRPIKVDVTLCEFFRLLRLKGRLLLTTPNPRYIRHFLEGTSVLGGAHISQHYITSLRRRLAAVGFLAITIRGSGRVSSILGGHIPLRAVYGSYLAFGSKW